MNVEVAVIKFLKSQTNWTVAGEVPADNPAKFITVERTGGAREAMVLDMAEVMISVYHKTSKLECANQTDEIADVIPGLLEDYADITRAKVNSVIQADDTIKGYRRYLIYADVYLRR